MQDISLLNEIAPEPKHHSKSFWVELFFVLLGAAVLLFIFGSQYATGNIGLSADMESASLIEPKDSVIIDFSHPMVPAVVEKNATGKCWAIRFGN